MIYVSPTQQIVILDLATGDERVLVEDTRPKYGVTWRAVPPQ
jgi:hypothetical protein